MGCDEHDRVIVCVLSARRRDRAEPRYSPPPLRAQADTSAVRAEIVTYTLRRVRYPEASLNSSLHLCCVPVTVYVVVPILRCHTLESKNTRSLHMLLMTRLLEVEQCMHGHLHRALSERAPQRAPQQAYKCIWLPFNSMPFLFSCTTRYSCSLRRREVRLHPSTRVLTFLHFHRLATAWCCERNRVCARTPPWNRCAVSPSGRPLAYGLSWRKARLWARRPRKP